MSSDVSRWRAAKEIRPAAWEFFDLFESYVLPDPNSGCWLWAGGNREEYGALALPAPHGGYTAHRLAYFFAHGSIDKNLVIDHLCRNKFCVNPRHLEQVSPEENTRRGRSKVIDSSLRDYVALLNSLPKYPKKLISATRRKPLRARKKPINTGALKWASCLNGHPFVEGSFLIKKNGGRRCKECKMAYDRKRAFEVRVKNGFIEKEYFNFEGGPSAIIDQEESPASLLIEANIIANSLGAFSRYNHSGLS